ncbi:lactate/malate family dehydrogenase [Cerasicoccus arenae]|uniref:L-lactate dehydrogenase n=1 Tax=Cerasicoccus arenae TaxID=424488 RepID=A0A8J3DAT3_9BACT|nr:hypothetical protein [Cerasicoccus arenae]MBK1858709.1 hypothetical protein [Cerasicoccus arenae]GHB98436.1 L-lactate dehydrogenase [Cerasicoccus arenae]
MNAAVIGGAGRLGSAVIAELVRRNLFTEITLIDGQAELCTAEIQDLRDACANQPVRLHAATQVNFATQSDIIILAGGVSAQPNESRLELGRRNLTPFCRLLNELKEVGLKSSTVVIIATEPSELLTPLAASFLELPTGQVFGLGTMIDARRLRTSIAEKLSLTAKDISISAIGAHGEALVPLWSGATAGGAPLSSLKQWQGVMQSEVEASVKATDEMLLYGKGGAWLGPAAATADAACAVARDERVILPVSQSHDFRLPKYDLRRTTLALPTIVGQQGAGEVVEFKLWPREQSALVRAARNTQNDLKALAT